MARCWDSSLRFWQFGVRLLPAVQGLRTSHPKYMDRYFSTLKEVASIRVETVAEKQSKILLNVFWEIGRAPCMSSWLTSVSEEIPVFRSGTCFFSSIEAEAIGLRATFPSSEAFRKFYRSTLRFSESLWSLLFFSQRGNAWLMTKICLRYCLTKGLARAANRQRSIKVLGGWRRIEFWCGERAGEPEKDGLEALRKPRYVSRRERTPAG